MYEKYYITIKNTLLVCYLKFSLKLDSTTLFFLCLFYHLIKYIHPNTFYEASF